MKVIVQIDESARRPREIRARVKQALRYLRVLGWVEPIRRQPISRVHFYLGARKVGVAAPPAPA